MRRTDAIQLSWRISFVRTLLMCGKNPRDCLSDLSDLCGNNGAIWFVMADIKNWRISLRNGLRSSTPQHCGEYRPPCMITRRNKRDSPSENSETSAVRFMRSLTSPLFDSFGMVEYSAGCKHTPGIPLRVCFLVGVHSTYSTVSRMYHAVMRVAG